jgi:hypothetical protein
VDRPAQEPPDRTEPPIAAADSPLSFPVEASLPPDVGASAPVESFRAEASRLGGDGPGESPLSFPVEAPRLEHPPRPAEPPSTPLPFPVAQLPGAAEPSPQPAGPPPQPAAGAPQQAVWPPQPAQGALHQPVPDQAATAAPIPLTGVLRFLPAALVALAALLAGLGSFLPLFLVRQHLGQGGLIGAPDVTAVQTAWGVSYQYPGQETTDVSSSPMGIPLLVAVALLTVAAFFAAARPGRVLTRALVVAGAAFTAGAVATIAMNGVGWSATEQIELDVTIAPGLWLLIGAILLAVVAAVVAHLALRPAGGPAGWADPAAAFADTPTPPSGVAITVLPPDDERP